MDFFKRNGAAKPLTDPALAAAQAALAETHAEEKKLRERCSKLELEKSLLQNFVDRVYSNLDDSEADQLLKRYCDELRGSNVELQAELTRCNAEMVDLQAAADLQRRKAEGLEAALNQVQSDLHEADATVHHQTTAAQNDSAAEVEAVKRRYEGQLEERNHTISQLMERASAEEVQHKRAVHDLERMLQRTVAAQDETSNELADAMQALRDANRKADGAFSTQAMTQNFIHIAASMTSAMESLLGAAVTYAQEERDLSLEVSLDYWGQSVRETRAAVASVERLSQEVKHLHERLSVKEARIVETRAFLSQSEERCVAAESEAVSLRSVIDESNGKWQQFQCANEELQETLLALQQKFDHNSRELDLVKAEQSQSHVKLRQAQQLVKDLQEQLTRRSFEPDVAPDTKSAEELQSSADVHDVLVRLTQSQEKVWLLEAAKTSYEAELVRLSQALEEKTSLLRIQFGIAAEQSLRGKGKAGILGPSKADAVAEVQAMLEESLLRNLELESKFSALTSRLEVVERQLEDAQAEGYAMEEESDHQCDVFD
jgi:chromosome segregation ATPase